MVLSVAAHRNRENVAKAIHFLIAKYRSPSFRWPYQRYHRCPDFIGARYDVFVFIFKSLGLYLYEGNWFPFNISGVL